MEYRLEVVGVDDLKSVGKNYWVNNLDGEEEAMLSLG